MDKKEALLKNIGISKSMNELSETEWIIISKTYELTEEFIREFQEYLYWNTISANQKLSENFIREFSEKINWYYISKFQKLSEGLIREFYERVDWYFISVRIRLSDNFIEEFKNNIHWKTYFQNNCVKFDTIKRFILKTDIESDNEFKTEHLTENQIREIEKLLKLKQIF